MRILLTKLYRELFVAGRELQKNFLHRESLDLDIISLHVMCCDYLRETK